MGTIKYKSGKCIDCPAGSPDRPLIANRCGFHYKINMNARSKAKTGAKKSETAQALTVYFASQVLEAPDKCENLCGTSIVYYKNIRSRIIVAHILPKRKNGGFPTVATHPKNRVFLCPDCHTNYDNKGREYAATMPALPIMRDRFAEFREVLTASEFMRVPDYLK